MTPLIGPAIRKSDHMKAPRLDPTLAKRASIALLVSDGSLYREAGSPVLRRTDDPLGDLVQGPVPRPSGAGLPA